MTITRIYTQSHKLKEPSAQVDHSPAYVDQETLQQPQAAQCNSHQYNAGV